MNTLPPLFEDPDALFIAQKQGAIMKKKPAPTPASDQSTAAQQRARRIRTPICEACAAYPSHEQMTPQDGQVVERKLKQKLQNEHTRNQR